MKFNRTDILILLAFIGLLIYPIIILTALHINIVLYILIFCVVTLTTFAINRTLSTILFYILLGLLLYIDYFFLILLIIGIFEPNRGVVTEHPVMDLTWIWGIPVGIVLTSLSIWIYHKINKRNKAIEIGVTSIFLIAALIRWIYYTYVL